MAEASKSPLNRAKLQIQLLGGFVVCVDGTPIAEEHWKSRRARSLVKLLALAEGHRLHRDQVMDLLWPDADLSAASNNLHQTLYTARRVLENAGAHSLFLEDGVVSLQAEIDIDGFEAAVRRAKNEPSLPLLQTAVEAYPGDLLPEDRYEAWVIPRREALRLAYLHLLLDLAKHYETQADYPAGIATLQRVLRIDVGHEAAHVGLMRLYALSGQRQPALRQYQVLKETLKAELDAEPGPLARQLYEAIQTGSFQPAFPPPETSAVPAKHNLPYRVSTFIGRQAEIRRVMDLLRSTRLLTITGAGGVGKTSLALKAAGDLLDAYPNGIWLVELARLSDPAQIVSACVQVLGILESPGISFQQQLTGYLAAKHLLLILDNCEHLLAGCASMANDLLSACPRLAILATSREPLGLPGETTYRLPSLALPAAGDPTALKELAQVESVRLFVERAGQVSPGFTITDANAEPAAQICRRLDGIPLAIELAAARVRMMTVEQLAARLGNTFRLLNGGSRAALPRQQTLKATIDWSYNLLSAPEKTLLNRLSVFTGGCDLEAAEIVCSDGAEPPAETCDGERIDPLEVLDLLGKLVDKSLVGVEPQDATLRYRLLETIRQYARDRLLEAGCLENLRDRHLAYFARLSGEAEPHLRGKGQLEWLARLDGELDNLRAALEWSLAGQIGLGLKIATDLQWYWHIRGRFKEGFAWVEQLLTAEEQERAGASLTGERAAQRGRALRAYVHLVGYTRGWTQVDPLGMLKESVALLRQANAAYRRDLAISLLNLLNRQHAVIEPSPEREELLAIFEQEQDKFNLAEYYWVRLGYLAGDGQYDQAEAEIRISLALCEEAGDYDGITSRKGSLAIFLLRKGEYAQADALLQEAIGFSQKLKNRWLESIIKESRIRVEMAQGHYAEMARLEAEILPVYQEMNYQNGIDTMQQFQLQSTWSQGEYARALEMARIFNERWSGNRFRQIQAATYAGRSALSQNDLPQAEALLKKAISLQINWNDVEMEQMRLLGWISFYAKQGQPEQAARLLGAVDWIYRRTALCLTPRERSEHAEALAQARAALGEAAFSRAWTVGQGMRIAEAIEYVRNDRR